jgi:mannose-1-phosphate guanylyltransferase
MNYSSENDQRWAILLAGGEGKRLSTLTQRISGKTTPKQFCAVIGNRSLVEQTRKRVSLAVSEDRILTAVTRSHERFYKPILAGVLPRNLVIQPQNRGTAPAILYALLRLADLAPDAQVALFPCDHFVDDDREFMRHVELAFDAVSYRPELAVLGIAADRPETSYGWIEPGKAIGLDPIFAVRRFWEKPHAELASELLRRRCLWNSFVMVARVSTLLGLFMIALPNLYLSFKKIRSTFGTVFEYETLQRLYNDLPSTSFSDDVLMRNGVNLGVLPVAASGH